MADKPDGGERPEEPSPKVDPEDEHLERLVQSDVAKAAVAKAEVKAQSGFEIHYMKSNLFRVIHADGAVGSLTSHGYLHMTLYSERTAIPKRGFRAVSEDGLNLEPEKYTETIGGAVRELEVDVLMGEPLVRELRDWLTKRLDDFAKLREAIAQSGKAEK